MRTSFFNFSHFLILQVFGFKSESRIPPSVNHFPAKAGGGTTDEDHKHPEEQEIGVEDDDHRGAERKVDDPSPRQRSRRLWSFVGRAIRRVHGDIQNRETP